MKYIYIKPETEIVGVLLESLIAAGSGSGSSNSVHEDTGLHTGDKTVVINNGSADNVTTGGQSGDGTGSRAKAYNLWDDE